MRPSLRLLQYLPQQRFVKVRTYAFYAAANRARLALAVELLGADLLRRAESRQSDAGGLNTAMDLARQPFACPTCGQALLRIGSLPRMLRPRTRTHSPPS